MQVKKDTIDNISPVEAQTGALFGGLWAELSREQYRQSVKLFEKRLRANNFDPSYFKGKKCLDVGTGSGRYAVAMALLGAEKVVGVDVSESGIEVARSFSEGVKNVAFVQASALDLPFESESFDFVCCAGVLHHTPSLERGLDEIARVLKPNGKAFVLLYGAGGLRWKLVTALRPIAMELGVSTVDAAIRRIGLPANNRKHFMDDFFVPIQTFINWEALESLLVDRGFVSVERWTEGRFDHEAKPQSQIEDMEKMRSIFKAISEFSDDHSLSSSLGRLGFDIASVFIDEAELCRNDALRKPIDVERLIIGEGNHRVIATFGNNHKSSV